MNITELENNMTKLNIFKTFANLKTTCWDYEKLLP